MVVVQALWNTWVQCKSSEHAIPFFTLTEFLSVLREGVRIATATVDS